jgi:ribosomal protein S18 acetylase RimI-like enzyme
LNSLLPGYNIRPGSTLDRALLLKFMQRTYQDMFPDEDFSHLARTVEQYFSSETPLWWVDFVGLLGEVGDKGDKEDKEDKGEGGTRGQGDNKNSSFPPSLSPSPIACLWVGNSIDQVRGDRHAHIFLLYVVNEHRRRGIGKALIQYVENWAMARGDRQIGLQVFKSNQPALNLYNQLGYQTQSLWMVKSLDYKKI